MSCVDTIDICVIRGDAFQIGVSLGAGYEDVLANPGDYVGNLVFREYQNDSLTPYLTLTATPEIPTDPLYDEAPIYLQFAATATQTATLPEWSHVHYCELVYQPVTNPPTDPAPTRLFQGDVDAHD